MRAIREHIPLSMRHAHASEQGDPPHRGVRGGRIRLGRAVFYGIGVASLVAIGYMGALIVFWQDQIYGLRNVEPIVRIVEDVPIDALAREPLPSSPRTLEDLVGIQARLVECIERCSPATVAVAVEDDAPPGEHFGTGLAGSGVVVTEDGYVLTAGHVVHFDVGQAVTLTFPDGAVVQGETLGRSEASDTGMIKITDEGTYPFVPLAEAGDFEIGEWCLALGFPGGYDRERGAVARIGRLIGSSLSTLRTDCKLLGGDSGGPLFNLRGQLIGIHSKISDSPDENYHAPISAFHRRWRDLQEKQVILLWDTPRGGYLGVDERACAPLEDDLGLLVQLDAIAPGSPAALAGLCPGDTITHIDNQKIIDVSEFAAAVDSKRPGDTVSVHYRRGGQSLLVEVTLGEEPSGDGNVH